jgi:hypothetical protein
MLSLPTGRVVKGAGRENDKEALTVHSGRFSAGVSTAYFNSERGREVIAAGEVLLN